MDDVVTEGLLLYKESGDANGTTKGGTGGERRAA
jgi:hypothetical protein